jgi:chlorite dismutase
MRTVVGEELEEIERLDIVQGEIPLLSNSPSCDGIAWMLQGFTSNIRYSTRVEADELRSRQPPLQRPEATCAAFIPIKKSALWWDLPQDERRAIFEETSHHTAIGMEFLPAIARQLYHSRDLGGPFDFLTWFEYAPQHAGAFEDLVRLLRATAEWEFVEREVDVRLTLDKYIN